MIFDHLSVCIRHVNHHLSIRTASVSIIKPTKKNKCIKIWIPISIWIWSMRPLAYQWSSLRWPWISVPQIIYWITIKYLFIFYANICILYSFSLSADASKSKRTAIGDELGAVGCCDNRTGAFWRNRIEYIWIKRTFACSSYIRFNVYFIVSSMTSSIN